MRHNKKIPRILLVGVGRFGIKHLDTLLALEQKGYLTLVGVVVATTRSQRIIERKYNIKVWTEISDELLRQVDAVDIVTPPETHFQIAMKCLPFTNVLVEKPLAMTSREAKLVESKAKKHKRVLMIGHIFLFDPVIKKMELLLKRRQKEKLLIQGEFINPLENDVGRDIAFELPHFLYIVDYLIKHSVAEIMTTSKVGRVHTTNIKYTNNNHAGFKLGWRGDERIRTINFYFPNKEFSCNFLTHTIKIVDLRTGKIKNIKCSSKTDNLTTEILYFLKILKKGSTKYPDGTAGRKAVELAEKANKIKTPTEKLRVAIIGAGIFGSNCAIELGKFCDVTLFEKNSSIMQEASFVNQYRHHWGYHYPRSSETVQDIRNAIDSFEHLYEKAIIRNFPTYYCIAKKSSKTSADEYLHFCRQHNLPFNVELPDSKYVDRDKISLSLKTMEPIYDYVLLKKLVGNYLKASKNITVKLNTSVVGVRLEKTGKKTLTTLNNKGVKQEKPFDYVINATYAKYNQFSKWLNFPEKPVRIDLVETLIVKLPLPKISFAIMDGPFTNLVPTPEDHLFTLVHIKESILERYVPKNGLPSAKKRDITRMDQTIKESMKWLPILKDAKVIDIRYVFRAVNANREHDDARPSDLVYHSFGCWSVLGGKIVNSVATAKEIALKIQRG